jgi:cytochrome c-type biogenesis protein CcsB
MGFESYTFGFNESTLTSVAYVCYLLAFVFYCGYLMTRSGRALRARSGQMALAGAGASGGGSVSVTFAEGEDERPPVRYPAMLGRVGVGFVVLAWLSLTMAIAIRWVEAGHYPAVTLYEIATLMVWGTTTVYLVLLEGVFKTRAAGAFVVLIIFCLQSYALWFIPADLKNHIQLVPALRSNWLLIHVSIAIMAYSSFATAAGAALTLLAKHHLKGRIANALPSEAAIEEFMFRAVAVGFPLQTLLLITGAIWAHEAWTKAWSWDPKETWALITWLTYAAYLHVRVQRGVRGTAMAWLSLIGFAVVLFTFMGVNYLVSWFGLDSMHTYNIDNNKGAPPSLGVAGIATVVLFAAMLVLALFSWLRIKLPRGRNTGK